MDILERNVIETVQNSYGRCLANGNVIETFYGHFLQSSPEVKEKFKNTDFEQQHKLLKHGINLMIMFADGNVAGKSGMKRIMESHARTRLNIEPRFYQLWKAALLKALGEHDRKFDTDTQKAWNHVLEEGIKYVTQGY